MHDITWLCVMSGIRRQDQLGRSITLMQVLLTRNLPRRGVEGNANIICLQRFSQNIPTFR